MVASSFKNKKELKFDITIGVGDFGSSSGNNQITLQGFRATAEISRAGGAMMSTLRARIYGVSLSNMNSVTTLLFQPNSLDFYTPNTIVVTAVNGDISTKVFEGNIVQAWGDFRSMPDVYLNIQAQAQMLNQLNPTAPRSFKGQVSVDDAMKQIATSLGLKYENNGVDVQLYDTYLANTGVEQAKELARSAGCDIYFDDGTLAICPKGQPRNIETIPLVSKDTGLWGYPTFDGSGLIFRTLFNPAIKWGSKVKVVSDITRANGEWNVLSMSHRLQSETPNGEWSSTIKGVSFGITK